MHIIDLIAKKRDGLALTQEEIKYLINSYTKGQIPDYQMSAFLMATYFQNMNNEEATYAPIMTKELGRIDWSRDAKDIRNLIRGTYPWPGAYSSYNGKMFKILRAQAFKDNTDIRKYGCISSVHKDSIVVSCGSGSLKILELQFENEKPMSVEAYLRGHNIIEGTILGFNNI